MLGVGEGKTGLHYHNIFWWFYIVIGVIALLSTADKNFPEGHVHLNEN